METTTPTPLKKKQLVKLLATAFPDGLTTSEIEKRATLQFKSKITRPTISKHTKALIEEKRVDYIKPSKKYFLTYEAYLAFWSEGNLKDEVAPTFLSEGRNNKVMTSNDVDASKSSALQSYIYDVLFKHEMEPSRIWDLPILRNIELGKWREGEAFRNSFAELIVKGTTISIRGPNFRTESISLDTMRQDYTFSPILSSKRSANLEK